MTPQPFSRPGVSLSTEKRDWKEVPVVSLEAGDLVRGMGAVTDVLDGPGGFVVIWKNETRSVYDEGDVVLAFVKV